MAERGADEEVIQPNVLHQPKQKDWRGHREEGLITISDDSDEDVPLLASPPIKEEDDEDDVVILESSKQQPVRPNIIIRPAAQWSSANYQLQGARPKVKQANTKEQWSKRSIFMTCHRFKKEPGEAGPSRDYNDNQPLQNFFPDELMHLKRAPKREEKNADLGRGNLDVIPVDIRQNVEIQVINLEEVDFPEQRDEVKEAPEDRLGGDALEVEVLERPVRLESPEDDVIELPNLPLMEGQLAQPLSPPHILIEDNQARNAEAQLQVVRIVEENEHDINVNVLPQLLPAEGAVPGPAFPQLVLPPAEKVRGEQNFMVDNEQPGPAFPLQQPNIVEPLEELNVDRELLRKLLNETVAMFPDIKREFVENLIVSKGYFDLNLICNELLENPEYPKEKGAVFLSPNSSLLAEKVDYFDFSKLAPLDQRCTIQAADLLMANFKTLSSQDIKWALHRLKGHYAITRKAFSDAIKKWQETSPEASGKKKKRKEMNQFSFIDFKFEHGSYMVEKRMFFLESKRRHWKSYDKASILPPVRKELDFYEQKMKEIAEHADFLLALQMNEEQYQKDGQMIECRCCYGEFAFEELTQCADGHLFCKECLIRYAQEAVFGSGKSELSCMDGSCTCAFPSSELEKVLPENILYKYYERQAEEAIAAACADELVRCPFCNFPALLDKEVSLFSCPNPRCRKETCRKCQVMWKDHTDLTCEEVVEKSEIKFRTTFEERMTAARIRKCYKCGMSLIKSEGCNRMSCRCSSQMCYLCRAPINGYDHFCQHPRSPGAPCRECKKCSLWTDPTQDDERIIQEIQKEAEKEQKKKSDDKNIKRIGPPPEEIPPKIQRVEVVQRPVPQNIQHLRMQPYPLVPPQFPLPPVPPMFNNIPFHPIQAPYVPPLPNMRMNFDFPPINVEQNLPMHYGPQPHPHPHPHPPFRPL
ncbi:E3 ubiquitin-protein ligase RNF216 isoform X2 [Latimeria chalumnae]|uniref:E3 ubiquitin-protein ligase RNF216 isoform X2 n=1 Tax=Latimeria chalumnae TaxID=7897 RepID=UPI0003C11349|nr:PREDICTED: E3 ubiquitin-protein ligase RNF216 isoform X2 [Latimeria chalumnae]|eukprot:XP_005992380.1 PREDICTED: E3 ubiquitin-protein ligase RNF216 isoform X2 [Latimeria chalumnae]